MTVDNEEQRDSFPHRLVAERIRTIEDVRAVVRAMGMRFSPEVVRDAGIGHLVEPNAEKEWDS